ncbi:MAG: hypothetical protein KDC99_18710 [Cyclobacteriaceae bacterium]|nr:hypothetical protein [Cyclobacteriaceae bacterium]
MRFALAILILIHGLIHLAGFVKAFQLAALPQLTRSISKPVGMLWLTTAILFIIASVILLIKKDSWWIIGLAAVVTSQVLISMYWTDARYGTIANVIILIAALLSFGAWQFSQMLEKEVEEITPPAQTRTFDKSSFDNLPEIVQNWLAATGAIDQSQSNFAIIKQRGEMKSAPDGDWASFTATHWVAFSSPAFVWNATMKAGPGMYVAVRDKFLHGKGSMLVKVMSLVTLNDAIGKEIDEGALQRYLAEIVWNPSFALNSDIKWVQTDSTHATATLVDNGTSGTVTFTFDANGLIEKVEAQRFYYTGDQSKKEHWIVTMDGYKNFNGIKVPAESEITWNLKDGNYTWFRMEFKISKSIHSYLWQLP